MQFDCAPAGVTLTRHMAGKPQRDADCRHQKVGQVRSRLSLQAAAGGPQGLRLETNRKRHLHSPPVPDFVGCQTHNAAPFHCETIRLKCSFEPHLVVWNNVFLTNTCCASGMLSSHRIKTFPINLTVGFIVMCKCGTDDEVSPDRFQSEEGFISREATQRSSGVF